MVRTKMSRGLALAVLAWMVPACVPPTAACPDGFVLSSAGRCVAMGDAGPMPDGAVGDAAPDAPVAQSDAGVGADGCALHTFYRDTDGDGHGVASMTMFACEMPAGYASVGDDCDDACVACHPGTTEVCGGGLDENCDGHVDEMCGCTAGAMRACGASSTAPCHMGMQVCAGGTWGACTGNLDPAIETCNGIDDDCDGTIDDGVTTTLYRDADGDGYGAGAAMMACAASGLVATSNDCDDTNPARHPGAAETCNAIDDDCSGTADDASGYVCVWHAPTTCTTTCGTMGTGLCSDTCQTPTTCSPPAETCNATDDNCDGVADEGMAMEGAATTAVSGTSLRSPHLVPFGTGYMVFYVQDGTTRALMMQQLSSAGAPVGAPVSLGASIHPNTYGFSARASGTHVMVGWSDTTNYYVTVVNGSGTAVSAAPLALTRPASSTVGTRIVVADFSDTTMHGTAYVNYRVGSTYSIRRVRLNFGGTPPVVPNVVDERDMASGLPAVDLGAQWDVVSTSSTDYIALVNTGGAVVVMGTPSGEPAAGASLVGTLTASGGAAPAGVAIAVTNPALPVSAGNPMGVAWQFRTSGGTQFAQVTGGTAATFAMGTAVWLPMSSGSPDNLAYPDWIELAAVPNASSFTHAGHWIVAASDRDLAAASSNASFVRAWEILGGTTASTATRLTLPTDEASTTRQDLSVATVGTRVRLAEETAGGAIITRQLTCM